jgi:hypothetical protein
MRKIYSVKPITEGLSLDYPPFYAKAGALQWASKNVRLNMNRVERRWDTTPFRTFASGDTIYGSPLFRNVNGTYSLLTLTDSNLCEIRTGSGETYSYLTDTYTTGTISSISGTTVNGSGTSWSTSGLDAGDKFITTGDLTAKAEPQTNWATIASIDSDTKITLSSAYTGTHTSGTYRARKVYTVPDGERWQYASVNGKFCFTNGNVNVQYWSGTDPENSGSFATDANATKAVQARYCTSYVNRLILADLYDDDISARNMWLLRTSKQSDPTNYTDSTSVDYYFNETQEPITGLGISGGQLVVYKKTGFHVGYPTGTATDPLTFPKPIPGVGLFAPYSLVNFMGTNAFMGADDFYMLNGDSAVSIGGTIRHKFFSIISTEQAVRVFGFNAPKYNEILWVADTSEGQITLVYNWKSGVWFMYDGFTGPLTGLGGYGV